MVRKDALFLVVGGTGTQGGAAARALLSAGRRVRVLTRNPASGAAAALAQKGAEIATGDIEDGAALSAAMQDAHGVFSVLRPDATGTDSERRHGFALVDAAYAAGVSHFVHSSVCQVAQHTHFPRWKEGYWNRKYWTDKWDVEEAVRDRGFAFWTILRPSFIMENFAHAKAQFLFPQMRRGTIMTPVLAEAPLQLIAGDDIGAFCRAAFFEPNRYNNKELELAADTLTIGEIASTLSNILHRKVVAQTVSPDEALAAGIFPAWVRSQEWINDVGYHVDIAQLAPYGVPLTSFARWVEAHAGEIVVDA